MFHSFREKIRRRFAGDAARGLRRFGAVFTGGPPDRGDRCLCFCRLCIFCFDAEGTPIGAEKKDRCPSPDSHIDFAQIPKHVVGALANGLQVFPDKRTPTFERMRAELSAAPVVAAEAEQNEAEEPEPPAPKKKNGLPNFVVGLISFAAALLVFSLAGWAYLAATSHNDEPAESSSQVSSGDVSSEDVSSGEEDASSGEDSSSSGTSSYQLQGETVIVPKTGGTIAGTRRRIMIPSLFWCRSVSLTTMSRKVLLFPSLLRKGGKLLKAARCLLW